MEKLTISIWVMAKDQNSPGVQRSNIFLRPGHKGATEAAGIHGVVTPVEDVALEVQWNVGNFGKSHSKP